MDTVRTLVLNKGRNWNDKLLRLQVGWKAQDSSSRLQSMQKTSECSQTFPRRVRRTLGASSGSSSGSSDPPMNAGTQTGASASS